MTLTTIFEEGGQGGPPRRWVRRDRLRLVSADELRGFAEDAGLVVELIAGDYELGLLGPGSERAILLARQALTRPRRAIRRPGPPGGSDPRPSWYRRADATD